MRDVADAAHAGFDVALRFAGPVGTVLDLALQGLDFVDLGDREVFAIDKWFDEAQEFFTQLGVAGDGANLDEGLPFPGAAEGVIVGKRARERARQRSAMAFGAEAKIDASPSGLIASSRLAPLQPAMCWVAPLIPQAM